MSRITQIRDVCVGLGVLLLGLGFCYREFYPKPAPPTQPDRIEVAASAYLAVQPTSLENVANGVEGGVIKPDDLGKAIKTAHLPLATELETALKEAGNTPAALRKAAAAMRRGMR